MHDINQLFVRHEPEALMRGDDLGLVGVDLLGQQDAALRLQHRVQPLNHAVIRCSASRVS